MGDYRGPATLRLGGMEAPAVAHLVSYTDGDNNVGWSGTVQTDLDIWQVVQAREYCDIALPDGRVGKAVALGMSGQGAGMVEIAGSGPPPF